MPNRTRSWFRPAGGVAGCPLDAPVILLKMARAGSSDVVQNLGKALPACRWDGELLHETNEMRRRAYLLPREAMVHKLPMAKHGEHQFAAYKEELKDVSFQI